MEKMCEPFSTANYRHKKIFGTDVTRNSYNTTNEISRRFL